MVIDSPLHQKVGFLRVRCWGF